MEKRMYFHILENTNLAFKQVSELELTYLNVNYFGFTFYINAFFVFFERTDHFQTVLSKMPTCSQGPDGPGARLHRVQPPSGSSFLFESSLEGNRSLKTCTEAVAGWKDVWNGLDSFQKCVEVVFELSLFNKGWRLLGFRAWCTHCRIYSILQIHEGQRKGCSGQSRTHQ